MSYSFNTIILFIKTKEHIIYTFTSVLCSSDYKIYTCENNNISNTFNWYSIYLVPTIIDVSLFMPQQ